MESEKKVESGDLFSEEEPEETETVPPSGYSHYTLVDEKGDGKSKLVREVTKEQWEDHKRKEQKSGERELEKIRPDLPWNRKEKKES